VFFFFQAEDGIRDFHVTGVQTCALPISPLGGHWGNFFEVEGARALGPDEKNPVVLQVVTTPGYLATLGMTQIAGRDFTASDGGRSEERRVGKEGRSRWSGEHADKKGRRS